MGRKVLFSFICVLGLSAISFAQDKPQAATTAPSPRVSTQEEIASEFDSVPCKNGDRLAAVRALFEKMGAKPEEITVEDFRGVKNVVVRKAAAKAESAEKIVIGAHFDKVADGCGAFDNWTGVVTVAHIYRTLKDANLNKTVLFVAFGEEEKGMVGSAAMVGQIKKEQVAEYCAMINVDSLGLAIPQVADNMSSKKLMDVTAEIAKQMGMPFAHARIEGAGADSQSFLAKKIPAVTIHAMNNDWPKVLHSNNDKPEKVNRQSVYLGYRLALGLWSKVEESPCDLFREGKEEKNSKEGKEKK